METLGMALGIIGGLISAPIFCFILVKFVTPYPQLSRIAFTLGLVSLGLFSIELVLVGVSDALSARRLIGPTFFPVHTLLTLDAAPSLACVLLLGKRNIARWWPMAAAICWLLGVFSIFYQYGIAEALYGVDGRGGAYSEF